MHLTPKEIQYLFPVTSVTVHPGGHLTVNRSPRYKPPNGCKGNKNKLTHLSNKSLRRLNHIMQTTMVQFNSMITLTYGNYFPYDGKWCKEDLHYVLRVIKKYSENYLWFLEFQARGAPHFHMLTECATITSAMRIDLAAKWVARQVGQEYFYAECPIGQHNAELVKMLSVTAHHKTWELIRDRDGARKYVAKYATKPWQKEVPENYQNVGRFWGATREVKNILGVTVDCTFSDLVDLLERHSRKVAASDPIPKYIWAVAAQ